MLTIHNERDIEVTRGDGFPLTIINDNPIDGTPQPFVVGDKLRLKVMERKNCDNIVLEMDFEVTEETDEFDIWIPSSKTKIGEIISRPVEYWYEIELNPDTERANTIMGYTKKLGAPLFILTPEGGKKNDSN